MTRMKDLEVARQRLKEKDLSLVFVKNSKVIFETDEEGLKGFTQAIENSGGLLSEASVADRIVGKAAALLCAYARVKAVFAVTMSRSGKETLKAKKIPLEYENLVPTILNRSQSDRCPFEKLVGDIADPQEAYHRIEQQCR